MIQKLTVLHVEQSGNIYWTDIFHGNKKELQLIHNRFAARYWKSSIQIKVLYEPAGSRKISDEWGNHIEIPFGDKYFFHIDTISGGCGRRYGFQNMEDAQKALKFLNRNTSRRFSKTYTKRSKFYSLEPDGIY